MNEFKNEYEEIFKTYINTIKEKIKVWDYVIITVANTKQKIILEEEIEKRRKEEVLFSKCKWIVVQDYQEKRIGSGGAFLNVLKIIKENFKIDNKKVLLINAGGESKRIIQYSYKGKIFIPTMKKMFNKCSILLDEVLAFSIPFAQKIKEGMLIATSDSIIMFDKLNIKELNKPTAITIKANIDYGTRHGVFIKNKDNIMINFLHKMPIKILEKEETIKNTKKVNLDTGIYYFDKNLLEKIYELISVENEFNIEKFEALVNEKTKLNFYIDFIYPLSKDGSIDEYQKLIPENSYNLELKKARKEIWNKISKNDLSIMELEGKYIHLGTLNEFKKEIIENQNQICFNRSINCNLEKNDKFVTINSKINEKSKIGKDCYIENSYIKEKAKIGENSMIFNTDINEQIPSNVIIETNKIGKEKYVTTIVGINDNIKEKNLEKITIFNKEISKWILKNKIDTKEIWEDEEKELWNAKLYVVSNSKQKSKESAIELYKSIVEGKSIKEYISNERISFKDKLMLL